LEKEGEPVDLRRLFDMRFAEIQFTDFFEIFTMMPPEGFPVMPTPPPACCPEGMVPEGSRRGGDRVAS